MRDTYSQSLVLEEFEQVCIIPVTETSVVHLSYLRSVLQRLHGLQDWNMYQGCTATEHFHPRYYADVSSRLSETLPDVLTLVDYHSGPDIMQCC